MPSALPPRQSTVAVSSPGAAAQDRDATGNSTASSLMAAAAALAALVLLAAPALWNGYPLLQYDTGGYLARWYEGYLVPSRSTVFGVYLHLGEGLHFWPMVIAQSALTIWVLALVLRAFRVAQRPWARFTLIAALCVVTTLPWLTGVLLTDIFCGLAVLALHLLVLHPRTLTRAEKAALAALIAFAAASHTATLAVLLAMVAAGTAAIVLIGRRIDKGGLALSVAALIAGAAMLLAANAALSGRLAWTPGGYGIAFGRMLQDGIVKRYLDDHCRERNFRLCPHRNDLPPTADDFLWSNSVFNKLGRFEGLGEEMRTIVLGSLIAYPGMQLVTALRATADQLVMVATGAGVHEGVHHTHGIITRFIPAEVPAMRAARQQHGDLDFTLINRLHVPAALVSMLALVILLARFARDRTDDLALFAGAMTVAILANAAVCGALSGPHDRYGARIVWVATLVVMVAAARAIAAARDTALRHGTVTAAP